MGQKGRRAWDGSEVYKGQEQAKAFFKKYQEIPFELVVTSTLQRTHQTVKSFIDKGIPWVQLPEINEMNWGIHEGKSYATWMEQPYKEAITEWQNGRYETRLENGESAAELAARMEVLWSGFKQERNPPFQFVAMVEQCAV